MCDQLEDLDELQGGFNFIGFSQGAQFARVSASNKAPVHCLLHVDLFTCIRMCSAVYLAAHQAAAGLSWIGSSRSILWSSAVD